MQREKTNNIVVIYVLINHSFYIFWVSFIIYKLVAFQTFFSSCDTQGFYLLDNADADDIWTNVSTLDNLEKCTVRRASQN